MSAVKPKCPRRRPSKVTKTGPTVADQIVKVLSGPTQRGGTSLAALKKGLQAGGYDVLKNKARILLTVRRMVANKCLVQVKGTGASGSFRLNKKPPTPRKKKAVKRRASGGAAAKKRRSGKVKRRPAAVKKASADGGDAAPSAPKAKKSPAKRRKSPKKAKRPAAAKKPKKSPRKAKISVARRATRAKAAAKK